MKPVYLRTLREKKGWTQERLEQESGIPQAMISRLENTPGVDPMFSTVAKLAEALGVDPRALRFGPEPKAVAS